MTSQSRGRRPACDQRLSRVDCPASGYPLPPQRSPMPRSPRALRTTLTMLVVLVATTESPASAWSPSPRTVSQGVRPGAVIAVGGLRFVVPPPGMGVGAEALLAGGGERSATVRTLADGTVVTWARSWPGGAAIAPPSTPFDKCADGGYALNSSDWSRIYRWRFRSRSTPPGVKRYAARRALRRAVVAVTHGQNHCRMPDRISAMSSYEGTTTRRPDIGARSNCESPDGLSVVGFGSIDASELSLTCWWLVGGHSVEADVAFNKANYGWTTEWRTGCAGSWSIRAVATH